MAMHILNVIGSVLILIFFYYTIKMFIFWFLKKVLKLKKMQDKKFRVFGEEL